MKHQRWVVLGCVGLLAAGVWAAEVGTLRPVACDGKSSQQSYQPLTAGTDDFAKAGADSGTVNPLATVAKCRGANTSVWVAIDSSHPGAKMPDVIRLDFSGEGRFQDALVAPLKMQSSGGGVYGVIDPVTVTINRNGVALPVRVDGHYYKHSDYRTLRVNVQTVREGLCDFGGKVRPVRVVDGDNNLTLPDKLEMGPVAGRLGVIALGDTLLVDIGGGNPTFEKVARAAYGHPVLVDGRWYDVTVSEDASTVAAAAVGPKTGYIQVDHDSYWLRLASKDRVITWDGGRDPVPVPAGQYEIVASGQIVLDSDQTKEVGVVMCRSRAQTGPPVKVTVTAGETLKLASGSPVTVRIVEDTRYARASGRRSVVRLTLEQRDAAGMIISDLVLGDNRMPPTRPVTFRVVDAAGKTVHRGTMEYG